MHHGFGLHDGPLTAAFDPRGSGSRRAAPTFEEVPVANYDDPKRRRPIDYVEEPLGSKDDPFASRRPIAYGEHGSRALWIAGAAALALVLALGAYAISTRQTNVTETKPPLTELSTTGSGAPELPPAQQK
jgi:hypothetical protein